jgi:peptidoglycan/LPS O-acetylase OafA/YrhL
MYSHLTGSFKYYHPNQFSGHIKYEYATYCVAFFFIISGFVIFMTVERCKSPFEFAYRRFIRIYPTYWICLIISSLVLYNFGLPQNKPTLTQFIVNTTMLQKVFNTKLIDASYWSLFPELLFYGIIFIVYKIKLLHKIYLWGSMWLICSFINSYFNFHYADQLFQYAGLFLSGILFYTIAKGDNRLIHHIAILASYITVVIGYNSVTHSVNNYIPLAIVYALFYLFLFNKLKFLEVKPLGFLGYISYPLYLIHQGVGSAMLYTFKTHFNLNHYWTLVLPVAVSIILAFLISKFFEKPVLKLAKIHIDSRLFIKPMKAHV